MLTSVVSYVLVTVTVGLVPPWIIASSSSEVWSEYEKPSGMDVSLTS